MFFDKPINPKWTKQGKTVSMSKIQPDKLDIGKASKTSKKVLEQSKMTDKVFEDAAGMPTPDMNELADFSGFMDFFKRDDQLRKR